MEEPDDFLNVDLLDWSGEVEEQVASLLERVRLSRGDVVGLRELLLDLERALNTIWPGCEVHPFGSIITGLGIKSSDVDVFVLVPRELRTEHEAPPVILARNILRRMTTIFTNLFAITTATVPILKFFHIPTGFYCDVNFKSPTGVRNSKLIFHMLKTDSRALSLTIIVKYWSKVYKFTGTNLLPNYALTMLVIFYLQQIKMLAPVSRLQRGEDPFVLDLWNTAFSTDEQAHPRKYNDNIYHLLGGFFKFYSDFPFKEFVISPFIGAPVSRKSFENLDLGNHFTSYEDYVRREVCKPLRIDTLMCIQDPFEHCRNCGISVSTKLFTKIKSHFEFAAKAYDEMPPDDFLKVVFTKDPGGEVTVRYKRRSNIIRKKFKTEGKKFRKCDRKMTRFALEQLKIKHEHKKK